MASIPPPVRNATHAEAERFALIMASLKNLDMKRPEAKTIAIDKSREAVLLLEQLFGPSHGVLAPYLDYLSNNDTDPAAQSTHDWSNRARAANAEVARFQLESDALCATALRRWDEVVRLTDRRIEAIDRSRSGWESRKVSLLIEKALALRNLGQFDDVTDVDKAIASTVFGRNIRMAALSNQQGATDSAINAMIDASPARSGRSLKWELTEKRCRRSNGNEGDNARWRGWSDPHMLACVERTYGQKHVAAALTENMRAYALGKLGDLALGARLSAIAHCRLVDAAGANNYIVVLNANRAASTIAAARDAAKISSDEAELLRAFIASVSDKDRTARLGPAAKLIASYHHREESIEQRFLALADRELLSGKAEGPTEILRLFARTMLDLGYRDLAERAAWLGLLKDGEIEHFNPELSKSSRAVEMLALLMVRRDAFVDYLGIAISPGAPSELSDTGFSRALTAIQLMDHAGENSGAIESVERDKFANPQLRSALRAYKAERVRVDAALQLAQGRRAAGQKDLPIPDLFPASMLAAESRVKVFVPAYSPNRPRVSISASEISKRLDADEALLVIVSAGDDMIVAAIARHRRLILRLPGTAALVSSRVAILHCELDAAICPPTAAHVSTPATESPQTSGSARGRYDRFTAWQLYHQLLAPLRPVLAGVKYLRVVTRGPLAGLPLAALVTSPPRPNEDMADPASMQRAPWLSDRFMISTLPSLDSLKIIPPNRNGIGVFHPGPVVGFGAPVGIGPASIESEKSPEPAGRPGVFATRAEPFLSGIPKAPRSLFARYPELPGTRVELNAIADLFETQGSTLYLGREATERAARGSSEVKSASALIFATHGLLQGEDNFPETGLLLTPPNETESEEDGVLTASEVAQLDLSADIVILSACNTATPATHDKRFNNMSRLADSFMYAGSKSLLASQWRVDDYATAELVAEFMRRRLAWPKRPRAASLVSAMAKVRAMRPDWAHPSRWAPFTLIEVARN